METKLKEYRYCKCGHNQFKFTEIMDIHGDRISLKICRKCGAIYDRDEE
jgi:hypothetical protein